MEKPKKFCRKIKKMKYFRKIKTKASNVVSLGFLLL